MALAYECSDCRILWPQQSQYAKCPSCGTRCRTSVCASPLTNGEAKSVVKHIEFQRFYRNLEEKRARLGSPTPEDIGKREAARLIAGWEEARRALGEG
jgi:hypothetical protein